jgi:hypothetical protein
MGPTGATGAAGESFAAVTMDSIGEMTGALAGQGVYPLLHYRRVNGQVSMSWNNNLSPGAFNGVYGPKFVNGEIVILASNSEPCPTNFFNPIVEMFFPIRVRTGGTNTNPTFTFGMVRVAPNCDMFISQNSAGLAFNQAVDTMIGPANTTLTWNTQNTNMP